MVLSAITKLIEIISPSVCKKIHSKAVVEEDKLKFSEMVNDQLKLIIITTKTRTIGYCTIESVILFYGVVAECW